MNTITKNTKLTRAQIIDQYEAMREALDTTRQELRAERENLARERASHEATKDALRHLQDLRAKAVAKAKAATATPENKAEKPTPTGGQPMTINEFCAAYCAEHGTKSVPKDVVKTWKASFKCTCPKCGGNGLYGTDDICYACAGTGEQTVADAERNKAYWRING